MDCVNTPLFAFSHSWNKKLTTTVERLRCAHPLIFSNTFADLSCFLLSAKADLGNSPKRPFFVETTPHPVQSPADTCWNRFALAAKTCQRLLKPLYTRCKALSTTIETPLLAVQSPVNYDLNPFTPGAMPCQQHSPSRPPRRGGDSTLPGEINTILTRAFFLPSFGGVGGGF
jgi:hypothetical protein